MTGSADAKLQTRTSAPARLPDFFIVGHHKCGTTALYEMLRSHPDIYMPDVKEPSFFGDPRVLNQPSSPLPKTLDEYLSLFAAAEPRQRVGEATPSYLASDTAARRIDEVQPEARIVAILREPASFLRSFHLQCVENHAEPETDFRRALALEGLRREGKALPRDAVVPEELFYMDRVRYVEQLRRYHAVFPREQVLVIIYEDFRRDNEATLRQVLRFLGVDDRTLPEAVQANPSVRVRSQLLSQAVRSAYLGRGPAARVGRAAIKKLTPRRLRHRALTATRRRILYGKPSRPDEDLTIELQRRCKAEVASLSDYLERDLIAQWGYEDIE
jgi:Sulfotransferase domain